MVTALVNMYVRLIDTHGSSHVKTLHNPEEFYKVVSLYICFILSWNTRFFDRWIARWIKGIENLKYTQKPKIPPIVVFGLKAFQVPAPKPLA